MALKKFMKKMFKGGSEGEDLQNLLESGENQEEQVEETPVAEEENTPEESLDVSFGEAEEQNGYSAVVDVYVNDMKLTTFNVTDEEVNIGRDPSHCTVLITEPIVSKVHCVMYQKEGALFIEDRESTNGTFIDGEKISQTQIEEGTMVTLGRKGVVKLEIKNSALV